MAKVKALSRIKHDGELFNAGDVIDGLTDKQAQQLIDSGEATKARATDAASTGEKIVRKPSQVKEALLANAKGGTRKTVTEKAQERQAKADKAAAKAKGDSAPKKPAEAPKKAEDSTPVADDPQADSFSFTLGDDNFKRGTGKDGRPYYSKNNKPISKVDFLTAQQEAGKDSEG